MQNSPLIIDALEADYLYVETSKLYNAGQGLFTAIRIYKHELIALFKGEVLTTAEVDLRVKNNQDLYFINMVDGTILDSMNINCFAKYANDAEAFEASNYKNNSKITLDDDDKVCIVATKNIQMGSEIYCSYGKKYWKKHR